jgi:3-hydroxyacyl-[acyl-carrier-protein] dehydratase
MRFALIDRVVELERSERIVAVKAVSLSEEYLSEHFPTFPVLPGVFMLECMVEAARWLVHDAEQFAHSLILLKTARGITYKSFVAPGQLLRVEVVCRKLDSEASEFSGAGYCGDTEVVKGRYSLTHSTLAARSPGLASADDRILEEARSRWSLLWAGGDANVVSR